MASPPPPAVDISPYQPSAAWQADAKDAALSERERRDREFSKGAANGSDPLVPFANNRDSVAPPASETGKSNDGRGEKQVKPNKVYIGGLPENTRQDDLRSCFSKIGNIVNIELKVGYGFVEFETSAAAQESVAKYNDGFFMGNKIRVEMSHGGGRTAKYSNDPGACFKCGLTGHWARECPNHPPAPPSRPTYSDPYADYPPPRDPYRDDYGRYPPPPRDRGYGYDYPPPRDYRRPLTPPRDYRDYAPPPRPARDYDDYRRPPPPRPFYPDDPPYSRPYDTPPPRDIAPDRRIPPSERYGSSYGPPVPRPRTPPGPPPARIRNDYDRPPPRDYMDYRGRGPTPPLPGSAVSTGRYSDYPPRSGGSEQSRRRSQSPPRTGGSSYRSGQYNDAGGYPGGSTYSPSAGYTGNGYSSASAVPPPPRSGGAGREREYSRGSVGDSSYSRRP